MSSVKLPHWKQVLTLMIAFLTPFAMTIVLDLDDLSFMQFMYLYVSIVASFFLAVLALLSQDFDISSR